MITDHGELCRELAWELADSDGQPEVKAKPMTRREAYAFTKRNVALGLQDPRDLLRYAS